MFSAGYAGWSPGQPEDEMKREARLTHPASLELVFDSDPAQLWKISSVSGGKLLPADAGRFVTELCDSSTPSPNAGKSGGI